MARYTDSVCRQCRREGTKLFLKGDRCYNDAKCAVVKRHTVPGQHGQARPRKASEYGTQLREKQKCRRAYGVLESLFRNSKVQDQPARFTIQKGRPFNLQSRLPLPIFSCFLVQEQAIT